MTADHEPLRIGLLGCGRIAQLVHLAALDRLEGVRLTALADSSPGTLRASLERVRGATGYSDYRDLLERSDVEAVVVTLPPHLHASAATAAFARGRHVYLEKPIAENLDGAAEIVTAWRRARRIGMIGFNFRFSPAVRDARRRLAAGSIGEVVAIRSVFTTAPRVVPEWSGRREAGGGALLALGSHHVDLVRHLLAREVIEAHARIRSARTEDDTAFLELVLEGGVPMSAFLSSASRDEDILIVQGTEGTIEIRRPGFGAGRRLLRRKRAEPSYGAALGAFVEAIRGRGPATPDLDDGYASLSVLVAAEKIRC